MVREGAARGGNGGGAGATDEGIGEVADGGEELGGIARTQRGTILAEDDIADPVATLDGPMAVGNGEQAGGVGLRRGQAGEQKADIAGGAVAILGRGEQAGDLADAREAAIAREVGVEPGRDVEGMRAGC